MFKFLVELCKVTVRTVATNMPSRITVVKWLCDYCTSLFDQEYEAIWHERQKHVTDNDKSSAELFAQLFDRYKNVDEIISGLPAARRRKLEARAAQLIAEEMSLQQLRRARKLTQQKIAKSLQIGQEGVSKLEQRSDLLISTLRGYVRALGGDLSLVAEFPDSGPIFLSGIAGDDPAPRSLGGRKRTRVHG